MTLAQLGTLVMLNIVGAASPGPDILLITRIATKSRKHAVAATLGILTGVAFWVTLTVLGAAAILNAFPAILGFVQLLGGAWIAFMGFNMVRAGWVARMSPPVDLETLEASLGSVRKMYFTGLTTNLANPKAILFFAALIAPLLPPQPSFGVAITVILALVLSAGAVQLSIAVTVSTIAIRRRLLRAGPLIDMGSGLFFIVAGGALAYGGVTSLL